MKTGHEDVTELWSQRVHTEREVTANRPDVIITSKKLGNMHTDRRGKRCCQEMSAKGSGKEAEVQEFMYRDTTNVKYEMYGYEVTVHSVTGHLGQERV